MISTKSDASGMRTQHIGLITGVNPSTDFDKAMLYRLACRPPLGERTKRGRQGLGYVRADSGDRTRAVTSSFQTV
jgi:hypothetical protein